MACRIIRVEGVPLTRELAQQHIELLPMPGEREAKPQRIKFLREHLLNGTFMSPQWAVGRDRETGIHYRLDGQHSSKFLSELAEGEFPQDLTVQMTTWEFDSFADDAADLFNLFNNPRSARSNEDVMGVYRAQVPALAHLPRAFLVHVANGIHLHENLRYDDGAEDVLPLHGPRERGEYFRESQASVEIALWLSQFLTTKNQSFMGRAEIVAEQIREWRAAPDLATEFWSYVFREDHPQADHETRVLAETFREWAITRRTRAPQYRAKAVKAWKEYQKQGKKAA